MPSQIQPCRKIFLQWLLSERVVEEGIAKQFFLNAVEQLEDNSGFGIRHCLFLTIIFITVIVDFNEFLQNCRQSVSPFNLDIKTLKFREDRTETELIGLVILKY